MGFFDKLFGRKEKYIPKERYTNQEGYRQHYNPYSPDARADGYAPVHRDSARAKYKRDILPNEVVHHRNGNKRDNRWRNLEIMDRSEHARLHYNQRVYNRYTRLPTTGFYNCVLCGYPTNGHAFCRKCWQNHSNQELLDILNSK